LPWALLAVGTILFLAGLVAQGLEIGGSAHADPGPVVRWLYLASGIVFGAALIAWPFSPTFMQRVEAGYRNAYIGDPDLPGWVRRILPAVTVLFGLWIEFLMGLYWQSWSG
jgi:hypothetical protein